MPHQATFISRLVHERLGGYDESFRISGDHDFFLRCSCDPSISWRRIPFFVSAYGQGQPGVSSGPGSYATMAAELERTLTPVFGKYVAEHAAYLLYGSRIGLEDATRCVPQSVVLAARNDAKLARFLRGTTSVITVLWRKPFFRTLFTFSAATVRILVSPFRRRKNKNTKSM